jgi:hypothetical protein
MVLIKMRIFRNLRICSNDTKKIVAVVPAVALLLAVVAAKVIEEVAVDVLNCSVRIIFVFSHHLNILKIQNHLKCIS